SIRITPSFSYQSTRNRSQSDYQTLSSNRNKLNDGISNTTSNNDGYTFRNDITWRKKFARKGRTFSVMLQTTLNESDGDGSQNSVTGFYDNNGNPLGRDTINQVYATKGDLKGFNTRAVYTEPIWKRTLIEFSAGRNKS